MASKNQLTREEILHLAKLARLILTDAEVEKFRVQLAETINYVENLNELDTSDVKSTSQSINLSNVFFEDGESNKKGLTQDEVLKNTKKKKDNYFLIDKIFN